MAESEFAAQNELIQQWTSKVRSSLKTSASQFADGKKGFVMRPGRGEKKLADSIGSSNRKRFGEIESISIKFERHGVFVHRGVGRGYKKKGLPVVTRFTKDGIKTLNRKPVDWFNPIMDKYLPELADRLAAINADAAVNATRMKIN